MALHRRFIPILALVSVAVLFLLYQSITVRETLRGLPQKIGLGDVTGDETRVPINDDLPPKSNGTAKHTPVNPEDKDYVNWNPKPVFKGGSPRPENHNYTTTFVVARTIDEDITWIKENIPDLNTAIYVADDPFAPLHPPKNKGHEVMIYLTYIIDHYDDLPDVSIFMHSHRYTWHNDDILDSDAVVMLKRLNRARVWREGYHNMRCSWDPGCPDWMHPGEVEEDQFRQEQSQLAKSWSELFPLDEVPSVLAQPCCAQFALSSERIRARPQASYVWYRDWLLRTPLGDFISGRIWEYVWQFVFTGSNIFCPKPHMCFCDGYGVCFGGEDKFTEWIDTRNQMRNIEGELRDWEEKGRNIEEAEAEGRTKEAEQLEKPEPGKDKKLKQAIDELRPIVEKRRNEAFERGMNDPEARAKEIGRKWKEGDGF
ncbi:uncharacterized protein BDZ99DRAFT_408047 [Mytilinidion resinicola]|uniref:Uncharacterized protein n=1 Tax=Mytilinidion resinicola TaxID=574789 RepID=A0A6A6Z1L9_9PEZI|nr:uncharacterized protein BDZ99DRAFT_408047 [Mytilinidion resinicola]KAF2814698.1 hypothetical protein BDZ99DRAFT_408047 [Mytilinidion resinicola]